MSRCEKKKADESLHIVSNNNKLNFNNTHYYILLRINLDPFSYAVTSLRSWYKFPQNNSVLNYLGKKFELMAIKIIFKMTVLEFYQCVLGLKRLLNDKNVPVLQVSTSDSQNRIYRSRSKSIIGHIVSKTMILLKL
jgi:hypothetical protein